MDGGYGLDGEEEGKHVGEADDVGTDDAEDDGEWGEEFGAFSLFGDLSSGFATFKGVNGLEEPQKYDESLVSPSSEAG